MLISNASNLYYLALPFEYNESPYPVHAYNIYRNSLYSANYTSNKDEIINLTQQTTLIGNYPNPFNPNTSIHFSVDKPGEYAIEIFNIKGQKINTLSKSVNTPGHYNVTWTGTDYNEKTVSSGIYFYRLANTENSSIKKMILIK